MTQGKHGEENKEKKQEVRRRSPEGTLRGRVIPALLPAPEVGGSAGGRTVQGAAKATAAPGQLGGRKVLLHGEKRQHLQTVTLTRKCIRWAAATKQLHVSPYKLLFT